MIIDPNGFQVRKPTVPLRGPVLVFLTFGLIIASIWGCGSNGGGIGDWQISTPTTGGSGNIQGAVLAPIPGLGNIHARISPSAGAAVDATVYLEERPDLTTKTDTAGKFLLRNVPVGKYHIIAELLVGVTSYRQRSDLVTLGSANTTQELSTPLQLLEARRNAVLFLHNRQTDELITSGITATLWGRSVLPALDGLVSLGPVTTGVWPVRIEGSGFYSTTLLVNFTDNRQNNLVYELTPLTAVDRNQAPFVEMGRDFTTMRTYQSGNLTATSLDPEGDVVTYSWEATGGTLSNTQGATTVLTAGDTPGQITIVVTGTDSKGGTGRAVMVVNVISGGALPAPASNLPPNSATEPQPANGSVDMGTNIALRWTGSDPNGDALRYDLLLWPLGSTSSVIATNLQNPAFPLADLTPFTTYFWQVIS
ncbi:MAG TPA: hypothetical protein PKO06_09430, partial [Candidatus Ozemobacteraceae bacterium]|nr:hypothetical protein [Candidatus Ozemobacteraceae bacterium]